MFSLYTEHCTHDQGCKQIFIKTEVPKWRLVGGSVAMLPRENYDFPDLNVCIFRCFKAHKLDNNIGLKPSQLAVA